MKQKIKLIIHYLKIIKYLLFVDSAKLIKKQLFDCTICGSSNIEMLPVPAHYLGLWQKYQTIHNIFFLETMNLEHYLCSKCFSADRDRLYALYLNDYFKNNTQINFLDIAPNNGLGTFIKQQKNIFYRSMDLMMDNVDDNLDITDMYKYKDGQFDFFICSHVLEHIPDDKKAMRELYRITKKGGKGIIMVPLNLELKETLEDPECVNIPYRWKYFFQDDHVRMYSKKDFLHRLATAGFKVKELDQYYFSPSVFAKNAICETSVLYVVEK